MLFYPDKTTPWLKVVFGFVSCWPIWIKRHPNSGTSHISPGGCHMPCFGRSSVHMPLQGTSKNRPRAQQITVELILPTTCDHHAIGTVKMNSLHFHSCELAGFFPWYCVTWKHNQWVIVFSPQLRLGEHPRYVCTVCTGIFCKAVSCEWRVGHLQILQRLNPLEADFSLGKNSLQLSNPNNVQSTTQSCRATRQLKHRKHFQLLVWCTEASELTLAANVRASVSAGELIYKGVMKPPPLWILPHGYTHLFMHLLEQLPMWDDMQIQVRLYNHQQEPDLKTDRVSERLSGFNLEVRGRQTLMQRPAAALTSPHVWK